MKVTFLGTASCFPTPARGVSCTALQLKDGQVWLFDCGEATQIQLMKSQVKVGKITKIFITHLHGDHVFGLPGLLCTLGNGFDVESESYRVVTVYGPLGIRKFVNTALELSRSPVSYRLNVVELVPVKEQLPDDWDEWNTNFEYEGDAARKVHNYEHSLVTRTPDQPHWEVFKSTDCEYVVRAGVLKHRIPCFGYVVREKQQPGKLDMDKAKSLGLKPGPACAQLKAGQSVTLPGGTEIRPEQVVDPPVRGRKIVILGDTCDSSAMEKICADADLILHEATMENALKEKAISFGHSTPEMAAEFALKTGAQKLCLFHLSPRYRPVNSYPPPESGQVSAADVKSLEQEETGEKLRLEAEQTIRKSGKDCPVYVAEDFMVIELPLNKNK